ncbi:MAG: uroporphyrinogen-III C-methyltransferase, partial [Alphaproteobacteria bacterium]|nr:uroporphyrinogen-III C-methyltransferase [Alphaproteobacteria bacterium]
INDLLVLLARKGRRVVRLKGGDPFIFGRGSEEALVLASQGVPFEIVPGITAAAGIGAEVGIPLTHRGLATGFRVVTGHCREDAELTLDWQGLADPQTTVVFYMSLANLRQISNRLIGAGRAPTTPVAAISCGTTPDQAQCLTTLARLPEAVEKAGLKAPTLLIVGEVASLAKDLNWRALHWIVDEADDADRQANA